MNNATEKKEFKEIDEKLKTISKRFMKQPINLENLDQVYKEMTNKSSNSKNEGEPQSQSLYN